MATEAFGFADEHMWYPLRWLGFPMTSLYAVSPETIQCTWAVIVIIGVLAFLGRISVIHYPRSKAAFVTLFFVRTLMDMIVYSCKKHDLRYVRFFIPLLMFLLVSNCIIVIPYLEEPTKDINTTLALSLIVFFYIQKEAIIMHGFWNHLNEFFKTPIAVRGVYNRWNLYGMSMIILRSIGNICIGVAMLPLEIMGKASSIISLAFRLFGNILTGSIIASLWLSFRSGSLFWHTVGLVTGINLVITLFFGLFEGCIQAFVFFMLSVSFLSRALQDHS